MPITSLKVIPCPKSDDRVTFDAKVAPIIVGWGNVSYRCGKCHVMLVERITHGQVRNIVIKCPRCGACNEIP